MARSTLLLFCLVTVACSKQEQEPVEREVNASILINEVYASGSSERAEDGQAQGDWMELYNAGGPITFSEGEWYLTDRKDDLLLFELPAMKLAQQQYVRIWCDAGHGAEPHAPFRLSSKGEWLALVHVKNGTPAIVDHVRYAARAHKRTSTSRYPDGGATWVNGTPPTPAAANAVSSANDDE